ncbi:MAG: hypothetical protein ACI8ZN_001775 [Bacteroidia bacterium]|jgi:hypothetical protein
MRQFLKKTWLKLTRYEYWPFWFFFLPIFPIYLYYAFRSRSLVYFTAANPGIEYGGFFGEHKNDILKHIDEKYKTVSGYFTDNSQVEIENFMVRENLEYPIIVKPDVGERGDEVRVIRDEKALKKHLNTIDYPFLVQEYVDVKIELGVLYHRKPSSAQGTISSIVQKRFLTVVGDGQNDVATLLLNNDRALFQMDRLRKVKSHICLLVPALGEEVIVERIGNHCLGTEFINSNHLINDELTAVFDEISKPFKGFHYGRYDLKVLNLDEMYRGKGIRIFELNGVTSEAGHIYDRDYTLLQAYKDVIKSQEVVFSIAQENIKHGAALPSLREIIQRAYKHFWVGKR